MQALAFFIHTSALDCWESAISHYQVISENRFWTDNFCSAANAIILGDFKILIQMILNIDSSDKCRNETWCIQIKTLGSGRAFYLCTSLSLQHSCAFIHPFLDVGSQLYDSKATQLVHKLSCSALLFVIRREHIIDLATTNQSLHTLHAITKWVIMYKFHFPPDLHPRPRICPQNEPKKSCESILNELRT